MSKRRRIHLGDFFLFSRADFLSPMNRDKWGLLFVSNIPAETWYLAALMDLLRWRFVAVILQRDHEFPLVSLFAFSNCQLELEPTDLIDFTFFVRTIPVNFDVFLDETSFALSLLKLKWQSRLTRAGRRPLACPPNGTWSLSLSLSPFCLATFFTFEIKVSSLSPHLKFSLVCFTESPAWQTLTTWRQSPIRKCCPFRRTVHSDHVPDWATETVFSKWLLIKWVCVVEKYVVSYSFYLRSKLHLFQGWPALSRLVLLLLLMLLASLGNDISHWNPFSLLLHISIDNDCLFALPQRENIDNAEIQQFHWTEEISSFFSKMIAALLVSKVPYDCLSCHVCIGCCKRMKSCYWYRRCFAFLLFACVFLCSTLELSFLISSILWCFLLFIAFFLSHQPMI